MRQIALALALLFALATAACTATPPTITAVPPTSDPYEVPTTDPSAESLDVEVLNTEVAVGGLERIAFTLTDASGAPVSPGTDVETVFYKISEIAPGQNQLQRTSSGTALFFGERLPGGGAWVVYNEFDASGPWTFDVNATGADGGAAAGRGELEVVGRVGTPRLNQPPPTTDTPALSGVSDITQLTSDPNPVEALYQLSVGEAVESGQPTVVFFGSPEHCDTDACSATLAEIKALMAQRGSSVNFIHVESRDLGDPTQLSETAGAWSLPSEPWTFIFDDRGFLAARIEGAIDRVELQLLLDAVL